MEEWKECKLGDISTFKYGTMPKKDRISENGMYPIFSGYRIVGYYDEYNLENSELILIARGVGGTGDVKLSPEKCYLTNLSIVIFLNENILLKKYAYYYFTLNNLRYLDSGSAQSQITISDLSKVNIKLPPLATQQKIARILSSLDDKIELNNKINTNLEQQAQALFKNWFVDFEPFGGKMPEGWKVGTIGDLCSTISKTYKSNDSHVILINTSDVENGIILNHDSVPNSNLKGQFKKTFQKDDILYSEIRPANKHYAFVDIETTSNYIASTKLMVIRPNEGINPHYLYHILTNPDLIQEMQHLAETRSGTFPQITFEGELSTYQIPLLPKEEQDKLGKLFEKIDNQIFHNIKENKQLSTIRDTLLPKLMNGEIVI